MCAWSFYYCQSNDVFAEYFNNLLAIDSHICFPVWYRAPCLGPELSLISSILCFDVKSDKRGTPYIS